MNTHFDNRERFDMVVTESECGKITYIHTIWATYIGTSIKFDLDTFKLYKEYGE